MHTFIAIAQAAALLLAPAGESAPASRAAVVQPEKQPPAQEPVKEQPPADPTTEDIIRDMEKERGNAPAPVPAAELPDAKPAPAAPAARTRAPSGRLLREGTFLVDRRGRAVRASDGEWLFTFDADARGQADPTMVLLPCQRLEQMEKLAERYGDSLSFTITGQVFAYHNRNYLLLSTFRANRINADIRSAQ